jgi:hypothetical protein
MLSKLKILSGKEVCNILEQHDFLKSDKKVVI